ncbi:hypothetical protein FCV82_09640 [Vibrio breoganii]|uniref:hypothetical protein n=1 Tax=Vibrio breoganii TaxID=553239 RepID=UPI000C85E915|nr:hypothetical protein [Vibrio breoganii]PMJ49996.1 hypothetical protein BCU21_02510 [Vibrio breoganii]PMK53482.1 hypothetical protein BCT97_15720 [Vibrio breoganii]PMO26680.1 hypothetical protein BCT13_17905 [Vibrio breoganii]PMO27761.1 hypothetical protein BCT14_11030 [Vibrio breoganii]PMO69529.1 hypothetical protein BCT05_00135 [Vibrio breoganii]
MDDLKLKAIDYFAAKPHDDQNAKVYLAKVYEEIHEVLVNSNSYNSISSAFEFLEKFISHVSDDSIRDLVCCWKRLHEGGELSISESYFNKYHTKQKIYSKIISLLGQLRYLEQDKLTPILFQFWREDESSRSDIEKVFKELSEFNLYAVEKIGFEPQLKLLDSINQFSDAKKFEFFSIVKSIFNQLLSTDIEGHSWNYRTVSVKSMAIPATEQIENLRNDTVSCLISMYKYTDNIESKKELLALMNSACSIWARTKISEEARLIVEKNSIDILQFWSSLIKSEPLELVQTLEHDAYWNYYHATSQPVRDAALSLEGVLNTLDEYQIYRDLVGYEGIFGSWEEERNLRSDYDNQRKLREERVNVHINNVSRINIEEWINRVELYLETDSRDLATFPELFKFVEAVSSRFPKEFLFHFEKTPRLNKCAVAIFRGIWASPQQAEFIDTIETWLEEGEYLWELSVAFLSFKGLSYELIDKFVNTSISVKDTQSLSSFLRILDERREDFSSESINLLFSRVFTYLNQKNSTVWINHIWFTRKGQSFIEVLSSDNLKLMVDNLVFVIDVDHRVEGVLEHISNINVDDVFYFFEQRIEYKKSFGKEQEIRYEDIPFSFYSINKVLAEHPNKLLLLIKENYEYKYGIHQFGIASLFKKCFSPFEPQLIDVVIENLNPLDENELKLILAMIKSYDGHTSIFSLVKRLLKEIECDEANIQDISHALLNTGATIGEYGYANALKGKLEDIKPWLEDDHVNVVKFAYQYSAHLQELIDTEIKRIDEQVALERHKYGENK